MGSNWQVLASEGLQDWVSIVYGGLSVNAKKSWLVFFVLNYTFGTSQFLSYISSVRMAGIHDWLSQLISCKTSMRKKTPVVLQILHPVSGGEERCVT